jgi:hypothetical protein
VRKLRVEHEAAEDGPRPTRFAVGERWHEVAELLDCWPGAGHRYLKLRSRDGALWILRHDERSDAWEVVWLDARPP